MAHVRAGKEKLLKKDPYLKLSAVYKFYNGFNEKCSNTDNFFKCNEFESSSIVGKSAKELHSKFMRNVKNLKIKDNSYFNNIDNGNDLEKRCIYLKYWLYKEILTKITEDKDIDSLLSSLSSEKIYFLSDAYSCEFYKMDKKEIREIKKIYEYFLFYNIYKKYTLEDVAKLDRVHCNYLKEVHYLYDQISKKCLESESESDYCKEFNNYIKKHVSESILSSFNAECKRYEMTTETQEKVTNSAAPDSLHNNNKYNIFDDIGIYQKKESDSLDENSVGNLNEVCQKIICTKGDCTDKAKSICESFIKLFLKLQKTDNSQSKINDIDIKYLNYWFNNKVRNDIKEADDKKLVFAYFKDIHTKNEKLVILKDKIDEIDNEVYDKMNILYALYDNYNQIETSDIKAENMGVKEKCLKFSENCLENFKKGITKYYEKEDEEFYKALNEFSALYKNVKGRSKSCRDTNLHALPEFKSYKEKNHKSVTDEMCNKITKYTPHEGVLKNFTKYKLYEKLNEQIVDKTMCTEYCNEFNSNDVQNESIKLLCTQMATNLKNLATIKDMGENYFNRCSYLTYWTYEQIVNLFKKNEKKNVEESITSMLNNVMLRVNNILPDHEKCIYYFNGNFEEWKEEKDLHDYFENYNSLNAIKFDENTKEMHCKYINYIYNLYTKHIMECCTCYSNSNFSCKEKCPKYFKCNNKYFPNNLLSRFKCIDEISIENKEKFFENISVDRIVKWITVKSYEKYKSSNKSSNIDSHDASDITYNESSHDPFYNSIIICFMFLGIFLFFFIFYKFTPLGSLFHTNKKKKEINYNPSEEGMQQFLEEDSMYDNVSSHKKRIRLNYHPE
ncbi:PIR Superfamily Protein [Plasmodium ovale wallikeri]|uniref:PIR Superfamily Protein n=1 Tax=Plasmodium ovale wallikeri TaxID=864142 RepID=A0A1A9AGL9_PLAOA|nr:PIR Superfamily Protein [Plasmodium ovale wallikeri]